MSGHDDLAGAADSGRTPPDEVSARTTPPARGQQEAGILLDEYGEAERIAGCAWNADDPEHAAAHARASEKRAALVAALARTADLEAALRIQNDLAIERLNRAVAAESALSEERARREEARATTLREVDALREQAWRTSGSGGAAWVEFTRQFFRLLRARGTAAASTAPAPVFERRGFWEKAEAAASTGTGDATNDKENDHA